MGYFSKNSKLGPVLAFILAIALSAYAADSRSKLKPGWNLFSPQQDVEMGREVSRQAERELQMLNDRQANAYVDALGRRLAAHAPGEKYPYQFKIVNDKAINAFALPGGFVYVNRGALEAADNEAQIAGVIAHEIGHVALRHGTNQASKAYAAQIPLAILGGALGNNSVGGVLAQLGVSFATSSLLLKYSRDAESQADLMGTQILYDSGYDPKAMVEFFEKIQAESKGRAIQFLSDHPNPGNRISSVQREIQRLGGVPTNARNDSPDFHSVKTSLAGMPAPRGSANARSSSGRPTDNRNGRPDAPSGRMVSYNGQDIQFRYPDNWRQYGQGSAITIAPDGGIINGALSYGMLISTFEPDYHGQGRISLEQATDDLLSDLRRSNADMRITRNHERINVGGRSGYLTEASNQSPAGGRETDWIITTLSPDGDVYYFVGVAPQGEFNRYSSTFEDIVDSLRFR
jgi:Zn-dependent protease with chaperone function